MAKLMKVINREQCIGCFSCMLACSRVWHKALTPDKASLIVKRYPGVEGAFSIRICYGCTDPDCANACPANALKRREGGGVVFDASLCIHCETKDCVKACVAHALPWDFENKQPLVCTHCGVCASFCPNNVLTAVEVTI